ncbi:MAG: hypothetical protein P4L22_05350 [Candidatus Babeliales bacterium]|nr:hypothetical protein [Candidatus Babeliales bacterium]
MSLKKLILISWLLSINLINAIIQDTPQEEYNFVLLIDHDTQYIMATFPLNDLKKCHFPEGPLRANIPAIEDFEIIDKSTYSKLKDNSVKLNVFCIEDGVLRCKKNDEEVTLKKCGFDVPGQPQLHYVFCIKEDIKNVSGHIVLRSEIETLQKQEEVELSLEDEIDDPAWELKAKLKIEDEKLPLKTKISNYAKLLAIVAYIQYLKIKDYFVGSYRNESKKDELSKFKPTCDSKEIDEQ